jgi:hypothetical protein
MLDVSGMRTTLKLDDDVLRAVKELARLQGRTAGEVLSELARTALTEGRVEAPVRNGVPLLSPRVDEGIVTPEAVRRLQDEP